MAGGGCRGRSSELARLITTTATPRAAVTDLPNKPMQTDGRFAAAADRQTVESKEL